jgi:hypothetical protein
VAVVSHDVGVASDRAGGNRLLLRRLMIHCPESGVSTDTGFELSSVPTIGRARQFLAECMECGDDHAWQIDEAFLE